MKTLFFFSLPVVLLAAGGTAPDGIVDPLAKLGAVAALAFLAIWNVVKAQPAIFRRLDRWDQVRHEDSERLRRTLEGLEASCREVIERLDRTK